MKDAHLQLPTDSARVASREQATGSCVMHQRWAGLLFLHWSVRPDIIQERLPEGLFVDTYGGMAWLGVVPFFMEKVRPRFLPPLPGLSWFMELNVRTYVYDAHGRPGVWFFSLDCNQFLAVEIARRFFHLPYQHAAMRATRSGKQIDYHCRRDDLVADYRYREPDATHPAVFGSLEWFLVERYLLFSKKPSGALYSGQVNHPPYQVASGHCEKWSAEPLVLNGFDLPVIDPSSILVAKPVAVKIFPLRKV